jgi:hypothetical protein
LQYEIELNYRGFQARSIIIEADSNFEAREKAKVSDDGGRNEPRATGQAC